MAQPSFEDIVFGQKFTRNAKNYLDLLLTTFAIFNTQPLWILIQGWEQGKKSHYIQPSNLSGALRKP